MRVLVLGGSGLIGNAVVRAMSDRGYEVTALGRRSDRPRNLEGLDVRYQALDLDDPRCPESFVQGHELVVDAASPYSLQPLLEPQSPVVRAERRVRRLLHGVDAANAALVHIGSISVGKPPASTVIDSALSAFNRTVQPYYAVKSAMERIVEEAGRAGTRTLILKPTACFGPWDIKPKALCWLPALLNGELPVTLEHRLNVIDTRDLADLIIEQVEQGAYGTKLPVVGHNTTVGELFETACRLTGTPKPRWSVPAELAILPSLWLEWVLAIGGNPARLPALVPMLLSEQNWVNEAADSRARARVALRPLSDTVADAIAWYRSIGYVRAMPARPIGA
jgi:dihydroflavonol-4-reductase